MLLYPSILGDFRKPKKPKQREQEDLSRSRLDQILDRQRPLYRLANQIDWLVFDKKFGSLYAEKGRPAKSIRLLVGLHYLKYAVDRRNTEKRQAWRLSDRAAHGAGQFRYHGAGESHRLSHRCPALLQGPGSAGSIGQKAWN